MKKRILIVEDGTITLPDLKVMLDQIGYEVCGIANSVNRALEMVDAQKPFLVLSDIYLKGELKGFALAHILNKKDIPFVFMSVNCSQQLLAEAKISFPYGFLIKPFRKTDLAATLELASYRWENKQRIMTPANRRPVKDNKLLTGNDRNASNQATIPFFTDIIGGSKEMMHVFDLVSQVAEYDTTVLLQGESGTGKEGIAASIHQHSPRKDRALITINCAALPMHLIESELFGYEKGSFTGAYARKIGKFERANGGTIFLDEIGELSAEVQVKLLRVLQEKEIERIGGEEPLKVDVRVIAATNRDLEKMVGEGDFRLDLYYRLNVFPIRIPALRSRIEDLPLLVAHFMEMYSAKVGKTIKSISAPALRVLMNYSWPGNVRELQNLIERHILLAKSNVLESIELPLPFLSQSGNTHVENVPVKTILQLEREHILAIWTKCNHRVSGPGGAAEFLDLPSSTLYSKMKRLGIIRKH